MKLNLDKNLVDLRGTPLPDKLSNVLANMLALATVGNPAKMVTWAVNLTNCHEIDIDKFDKMLLIEFIEKHSHSITNLAKAQLIEEIEKLKE